MNKELPTIGKFGTPIDDWKQEQIKFLDKSLERTSQRIKAIRKAISQDFNSVSSSASIVKSCKSGVIVRYAVTHYLISNEIWKDGKDISISDEINTAQEKIKSKAKEFKAREFNSEIIKRPTVSGDQPSSVEAEFLIEMDIR